MLKIGLLCSGNLGLNTFKKLFEEYKIEFVLTDKNSLSIIDFADINKIPFYAGNPRKNKGYSFIKSINVDVIISVNYLFLIEGDIINHSNILTFNIHGSLLPKYRGRTPHVWSIINGENETGITAHIIDSGCDTGKIIEQIRIPIEQEDTGATILKKYKLLYYPLIKRVLDNIKENKIVLKEQNNLEASYYGKRTPLDGKINWNSSSLELYNWIRAQAAPYPGAFTFYLRKKIIIDKVSIVKTKEYRELVNGQIIKIEPDFLVKTSDGVICLEVIREEKSIFTIGNIFGDENRK